MRNVEIRRPRKEQVEELNQFFELVIRDTFNKNNIADLIDTLEEEVKDKRRALDEDIESGGKDKYFLVATIDEMIIGTIAHGKPNELIQKYTLGELNDIHEIGTVYVHPEFQQQGIGNLLLSEMFEVLKEKKIEEFCLDSGYKSAQKIWSKKFGEPEYLFKDFWGDGADHMIWRLKLIDVLK